MGCNLGRSLKVNNDNLDGGGLAGKSSGHDTTSDGSTEEEDQARTKRKKKDSTTPNNELNTNVNTDANDCQEKKPVLDSEQMAIIENTWKLLVENISRVGVITFIGLFETHPDVQQLFLPFKNLSPEDLKYSKELRAHALRVMGAIQKIVARLKQSDKCEQLITDLGKRHSHYGAKPEYIELVGQQFIFAIKPSLENIWSDAVEEAWNMLFSYIDFHMRRGMNS